MESPILVIDSSGICHIQKHSMAELTYDEQAVGVIFGFFRQLYRLMEHRRDWRIVFAWDSSDSERRKIFPPYKANRGNGGERSEYDIAAHKQFITIRNELLPLVGFRNNFLQTGFEADDIIAQVVGQYCGGQIIIASADGDLYQLLSPEVAMYDLRNKKLFGVRDFYAKYDISPSRWAEVKEISGCSTDNVPGIPKIGWKTAIKYLKGDLKSSTTAYKSITSSEGESIIERNRKLVKLPFEGTNDVEVVKEDRLNAEGFVHMCQTFGFESFITDFKKWKHVLNLQ